MKKAGDSLCSLAVAGYGDDACRPMPQEHEIKKVFILAEKKPYMNRRSYLGLIGTGSIATVAGCLGNGDDDGDAGLPVEVNWAGGQPDEITVSNPGASYDGSTVRVQFTAENNTAEEHVIDFNEITLRGDLDSRLETVIGDTRDAVPGGESETIEAEDDRFGRAAEDDVESVFVTLVLNPIT